MELRGEQKASCRSSHFCRPRKDALRTGPPLSGAPKDSKQSCCQTRERCAAVLISPQQPLSSSISLAWTAHIVIARSQLSGGLPVILNDRDVAVSQSCNNQSGVTALPRMSRDTYSRSHCNSTNSFRSSRQTVCSKKSGVGQAQPPKQEEYGLSLISGD